MRQEVRSSPSGKPGELKSANGRESVKRLQASIRGYILLFVFLSCLYHSNLRPIASGDSLPASLIPFSILLDGSVTLDRFGPYVREHIPSQSRVLRRNGAHYYSVYPIAGPVLTTPLYLPVALVPWFGRQSPATLIAVARIAEKFVAVALAAATALALLVLLRRLTSGRAAWMLTLVFALGTANWSTASQALFQHVYGQLAIIGCLYGIERWSGIRPERWYWITGLFVACAVAIRPTNIALLPALGAALVFQRSRPANYVRLFAPAMLGIIAVAAYNLYAFQTVAGGYEARVAGQFVGGLLGVLLSPGRGLLVYTPIVIFAAAAFTPQARESRERHMPVFVAAGVFAVLHVVAISLWPMWWGGYCWGPRLLTEMVVPALVLIAIGLPALRARTWKCAFAATTAYCVFIQALGVYCYPKGRWDHLPVPVDVAPARLWHWTDSPIVRTAQGGLAWEPYAVVGAALTGGMPAASKKLKEIGINPH